MEIANRYSPYKYLYLKIPKTRVLNNSLPIIKEKNAGEHARIIRTGINKRFYCYYNTYYDTDVLIYIFHKCILCSIKDEPISIKNANFFVTINMFLVILDACV